jgi:hypothetical protein
MGMQLQEIDHEMIAAAEMLGSDDPEQVAAGTQILEALLSTSENTKTALAVKADRVLICSERLIQQAAMRKAVAQRLTSLYKADEAKASRLQQYVIKVLTTLNPKLTEMSLATHDLTSRQSEAVALDPEIEADPQGTLPESLLTVKTTYSPDKAAIKAHIKAGNIVKGAAVVKRRNWTIK